MDCVDATDIVKNMSLSSQLENDKYFNSKVFAIWHWYTSISIDIATEVIIEEINMAIHCQLFAILLKEVSVFNPDSNLINFPVGNAINHIHCMSY